MLILRRNDVKSVAICVCVFEEKEKPGANVIEDHQREKKNADKRAIHTILTTTRNNSCSVRLLEHSQQWVDVVGQEFTFTTYIQRSERC